MTTTANWIRRIFRGARSIGQIDAQFARHHPTVISVSVPGRHQHPSSAPHFLRKAATGVLGAAAFRPPQSSEHHGDPVSRPILAPGPFTDSVNGFRERPKDSHGTSKFTLQRASRRRRILTRECASKYADLGVHVILSRRNTPIQIVVSGKRPLG